MNRNNLSKDEERFIQEYYFSLSHIIETTIKHFEQEADFIKNDKEVFKLEYLILLFWLTIQKFANIIDDKEKQDRLLDKLHNTHYELVSKRIINYSTLELLNEKISKRYRQYDKFIPLNGNDNQLFKLVRCFLKNMDDYHNTYFSDNPKNLVIIPELITTFFKLTEFINKDFVKREYNF